MPRDTPGTPVPDTDHDAVIAGLQTQIDDLTAVLESHARLFEVLRASGVLFDDERMPS